jgi:hypothetical protein
MAAKTDEKQQNMERQVLMDVTYKMGENNILQRVEFIFSKKRAIIETNDCNMTITLAKIPTDMIVDAGDPDLSRVKGGERIKNPNVLKTYGFTFNYDHKNDTYPFVESAVASPAAKVSNDVTIVCTTSFIVHSASMKAYYILRLTTGQIKATKQECDMVCVRPALVHPSYTGDITLSDGWLIDGTPSKMNLTVRDVRLSKFRKMINKEIVVSRVCPMHDKYCILYYVIHAETPSMWLKDRTETILSVELHQFNAVGLIYGGSEITSENALVVRSSKKDARMYKSAYGRRKIATDRLQTTNIDDDVYKQTEIYTISNSAMGLPAVSNLLYGKVRDEIKSDIDYTQIDDVEPEDTTQRKRTSKPYEEIRVIDNTQKRMQIIDDIVDSDGIISPYAETTRKKYEQEFLDLGTFTHDEGKEHGTYQVSATLIEDLIGSTSCNGSSENLLDTDGIVQPVKVQRKGEDLYATTSNMKANRLKQATQVNEQLKHDLEMLKFVDEDEDDEDIDVEVLKKWDKFEYEVAAAARVTKTEDTTNQWSVFDDDTTFHSCDDDGAVAARTITDLYIDNAQQIMDVPEDESTDQYTYNEYDEGVYEPVDINAQLKQKQKPASEQMGIQIGRNNVVLSDDDEQDVIKDGDSDDDEYDYEDLKTSREVSSVGLCNRNKAKVDRYNAKGKKKVPILERIKKLRK